MKRLERGKPLDQAVEVFRGAPDHVAANAFVLRDADGRLQAVLASRSLTFYEEEVGCCATTAPRCSSPSRSATASAVSSTASYVFATEIAWNGLETGDLLAYDLAALNRDPASATPTLVLRPGARESIEGVTVTRDALVVNLSREREGAASSTPRRERLDAHALALPESTTIGLGSASRMSDELFLSVSGFCSSPSSPVARRATSGKVGEGEIDIRRVDTSALEMTQVRGRRRPTGRRCRTSSSGRAACSATERPRRCSTATAASGQPPARLFRTIGKLWLESGGVYVVANTRGGGEFGPAWHRPRRARTGSVAHDDFAAVARDLIARKITSPRAARYHGRIAGADCSWASR